MLKILVGEADFVTAVFRANRKSAPDAFFKIKFKTGFNFFSNFAQKMIFQEFPVLFGERKNNILVRFFDLTPGWQNPGDDIFDEIFVIKGFFDSLVNSFCHEDFGNLLLDGADGLPGRKA